MQAVSLAVDVIHVVALRSGIDVLRVKTLHPVRLIDELHKLQSQKQDEQNRQHDQGAVPFFATVVLEACVREVVIHDGLLVLGGS
jgi:hypothetical protein